MRVSCESCESFFSNKKTKKKPKTYTGVPGKCKKKNYTKIIKKKPADGVTDTIVEEIWVSENEAPTKSMSRRLIFFSNLKNKNAWGEGGTKEV